MRDSTHGVADVLENVRRKGVRLWSENGRLRYSGPKGALTDQDLEQLKVSRERIVALLEEVTGGQASEPRLEPRSGGEPAPLAYSQWAHWHLFRLGERPSYAVIAYPIRLRGRLDIGALRRSLAEIVRRHD